MDKELYRECKMIIKSFVKKEYWGAFSSSDLFYIADDMKNRALFSFIEQFFGDAYGCQLFFNKRGFNYVHDILTTQSEMVVSLYDCDSLCAVLIPKKELRLEEERFLRENHIRITENDNLLFYRFEPGHLQRFANNKELLLMLRYLNYLESVIKNEFKDIVEAFKNGLTVISLMDTDAYEYSVLYEGLPLLERNFRKSKGNTEFVEEFRNKPFIDEECYFFASYLPLVSKETRIRSMILYFYFSKSHRHYFKYFISDPKEYKNLIFGILYDVFTEVGKPVKLFFNNREFYALVENTIQQLHIEHHFLRESETVDSNMAELIARVYQQTEENEIIEEESLVQVLMDAITGALNELTNQGEENFDLSLKKDFIS